MIHGRRRPAALLVCAAITITMLSVVPPASAVPPPTLRLFAATPHVTVPKYGHGPVQLDLGVWVASVGGAFQLNVSRPDYQTPVGIAQVDAETGNVLRPLPATFLDGWYGLARFLDVTLRDADGRRVSSDSYTFCPNSYDADRVDDSGPAISRYPVFCSANPFTIGMVWGIEDHWAVNPGNAYPGITVKVPTGEYTATVQIAPEYASTLGIPAADASATVDVTIEKYDYPPFAAGHHNRAGRVQPSDPVPTVTDPPPATLPDLGALPAWSVYVSRDSGRDNLTFAATAWNAGPQPLVVEGFRRVGTDVMDAYQYFYSDGQPVARAPVGTFEYDARPGHEHWHFQQFATYTLLDADKNEIVPSEKEAFCLAPTDAIDLTAPGANWAPYSIGLGTACGTSTSIWVRETLDAGWGDTYFQSLPGQSFDITDLPNGRYYIKVEVNPTGLLHETSTDNNVSYRRVRLKGSPGHRTVVVPPYFGIDSESDCPFCY
jgi:hypothetical protein